MQKGERKLGQLRKRIVQLLEEYGYQCHRHGDEKKGVYTPDYHIDSPQAGSVDGDVFESDLKKFNFGEAFWRAESFSSDIEMLPYSQRNRDPEKRNSLDECRSLFYDYLQCGYEFEYQSVSGDVCYSNVQLVDYQQVENNTFRAVTLWDGLLRDGFYWDVVVTINTMPLVVVVLEPTAEGHRPCQDAIESLQYQLKHDNILSTFLQFCIVSDGKHTLVGTPTDGIDNFKPWGSLIGEEGMDDVLTPIRAFLRPDRLVDVLHNYCWQEMSLKGRLFQYMADYHQFFAIKALLAAIRRQLHAPSADRCWGHVKMHRQEAESIYTVWGDQTHILANLLYQECLQLPELWEGNRQGEPWSVRLVEKMPDAESLSLCTDFPGRILFVALPGLSTAQCRELLAQVPTGTLLQIALVGGGPFVDDFCGPCLYRVVQPMKRPDLS